MKDGSAHPNGPDWAYSGEDGAAGPLWGVVPAVTTTAAGDEPEQRAATELERITDRYRDKLPSVDAAQAAEIALAARCLYAELYRDCGPEARRQKLKGAWLLVQWAEKIARKAAASTEEKKRARAYMALDVIAQGVERRAACQMASQVAAARGLKLGQQQSFLSALAEYEQGPDWLTSSLGNNSIYQPVTAADLDALEQRPPSRQQLVVRDQLLSESGAMMPAWWPTSERVRQLRKKADYLQPLIKDDNPDLRAILQIKGWQLPLLSALKVSATLPPEKALRQLLAQPKNKR